MPQTLSEIRALLDAHGLRPKKRFGQNFLHDANHMNRIMQAAALSPDDLVLEVGPGTGALTERLLEAGANVVAVEVDADLEPILHERAALHADRFTLIMGDVMASKHALSPAVIEAVAGRPFKLIANLPYNVASPLLATLAIDHPHMTQAVVMIQREVADRITAPPGNKQYGQLGILLQAMFEADTVGTLSPQCFWPAPQVASAVVRLRRRERPLTDQPAALSRLLHTLFSRRRKQIGKLLPPGIDLPAGVEPTMRPEALSVDQLCRLADRFC